MALLTTTSQVHNLVQRLLRDPSRFIALDTEFMRETTYYSKLCLIQIAGQEEAVVIDALSSELDLDVLKVLMFAPNILKVLHSSRQDLEIFYTLWHCVPRPLFDTQIAAQFCGFGACVGYEPLVNKYLKASIDKSLRLTDWSKRPLTERQESYALSDVVYLRSIYQKMIQQLQQHKRSDWIQEDMSTLEDPSLYYNAPDSVWKKLKIPEKIRNPRILARIREIAKVREVFAQEKNIPRKWVISDELIVESALQRPKTLEELKNMRHMQRGHRKIEWARLVIQALETADRLPLSSCPSHFKEPQRLSQSCVRELLKFFLHLRSKETGITSHVIASEKNLKEFASQEIPQDHPLLKGWRYEIFGREALKLKRGELFLSVKKGKVVVQPL